jgi:hypothetical protein
MLIFDTIQRVVKAAAHTAQTEGVVKNTAKVLISTGVGLGTLGLEEIKFS